MRRLSKVVTFQKWKNSGDDTLIPVLNFYNPQRTQFFKPGPMTPPVFKPGPTTPPNFQT